MFAALLVLFVLPFTVNKRQRDIQACIYTQLFDKIYQIGFAIFVVIFLTLMYLGMCPASEPYVFASKIFTMLYFFYFLIFTPIFGLVQSRVK